MTPSNSPYSIGMILDVHREPLDGRDRATAPSARPTTAARRRARAGSRSAGGWPGASARRRSAACGPPRRRCAASVAGRFRRLREVALLLVLVERHGSAVALLESPSGADRPDEHEHDERGADEHRRHHGNSVANGIVSMSPAIQPASLLPNESDRNHTPIIRPTMRGGASFGYGAHAHRTEAQLAELGEEVRRDEPPRADAEPRPAATASRRESTPGTPDP